MDIFTKFVRFYPCKRADTKSTIRALEKYISENCKSGTILGDNGSNFTSHDWKRHWNKRAVKLRYTSVYQPASNPAERIMQTLAEGIRMQVDDEHQGRWPMLLPGIEAKLNCSEHTTTGVAPIILQQRLKPGIGGNSDLQPITDQEYAQALETLKKITASKLKQRLRYFRKYHQRTIQLKPGEIVYVMTHKLSSKADHYSKKLGKKFSGPWVVVDVLGKNAYRVQNLQTNICEDHHINNFKV